MLCGDWINMDVISLFYCMLWTGCFIGHSAAFSRPTSPIAKEYCEGDTFSIACPQNHVILMNIARYGRMSVGTCLSSLSNPCETNVLSLLDSKCSGKSSCDMAVSSIYDSLDENSRRCTSEMRGFLLAGYECIPVVTNPHGRCALPGSTPGEITAIAGYLSSTVTRTSGCGNYDSPWRLNLPPGYRIRLSLYDFALRSPQLNTCVVYAVVKDVGSSGERMTQTICSTGSRFTPDVYESSSSQLEFRLPSPTTKPEGNDGSEYLVKYTAVGCPIPPVPSNGWLLSTPGSLKATVGCNYTGEVRELACKDGQWGSGEITCPPLDTAVKTGASSSSDSDGIYLSGAKGFVIIIVLGTTATIALVIFVIGMIFIRRKRNRFLSPTIYDASSYQRPSLADYYSHAATVPNFRTAPPHSDAPSQTKYLPHPASTSTLPGHNDYKRTWQMKYRHDPFLDPCAFSSFQVPEVPSSPVRGDARPVSEHIYESPVFGRKVLLPSAGELETRRPRFELTPEYAPGSFTD